MHKRLLLLSLVFLFLCPSIMAQTSHVASPQHAPIAPLQHLIRFDRIMVEDGLSNNVVNCILQDRYGFMWFGTQNGLNRYDGKSIKVYRTIYGDTTTLFGDNVTSLAEDRDGNLWVATWGLQRYDRENDNFVRFPSDTAGIHGPLPGTAFLAYDSSGILWLASESRLQKFDLQKHTFTNIDLGNDGIPIWAMTIDRKGNVWITSMHSGQNVRIDKTDLTYQTFTSKRTFHVRPNEQITVTEEPKGIFVDERDSVWVYGDRYISKLDWRKKKFRYVVDTSNWFFIHSMVKDREGRVWAGTYTKGLQLLKENFGFMESVVNVASDLHSLSGATINYSYLDRAGNVWFGTERGVSKMARWAKPFVHFSNDPVNSGSLVAGEIVAINEDGEKNLWCVPDIGTIERFDRRTGTFKHYPFYEYTSKRQLFIDQDGALLVSVFAFPLKYNLARDRFYDFQFHPSRWSKKNHFDAWPPDDMLRESDGTIWWGYHNKLAKVSKEGKHVRWYNKKDGLLSLEISQIHKDKTGTVWVNPSGNGLARYDPVKDHFISIRNTDFQADVMFEDSNGNFWIGSTYGLMLYNAKEDSIIKLFDRKDGLGPLDQKITSLHVLGISEDDHKNLWLQTDAGIAKLNIRTYSARYYGPAEGIPAPSRNRFLIWGTAAHVKTKRGEMVFGLGASGIVMFYPDDIKDNPNPPSIVLSDFKLFNEPVKIGRDFPLKKNILLSDKIELMYDQNEFTFEFAALDYTAPAENQYAYKLEGYDKDWIKSGNRNVAYYTNIAPGEYIFRVKASNNDGVWNERGISIEITISPPWWKTTWAYIGYLLVIVVTFYSTRRYELNRQRLKIETKNLKDIDQIKSKFFANISHEFRTPLTLIDGPAGQLVSGEAENPKEIGQIIRRNSQRLLRLVNQLLDLSKIESGGMKLQKQTLDIVQLVKGIAASFESLAGRKGITFEIHTSEDSLIGSFERDAVEKIVTNLLSNAFKFTSKGGSVSLALSPNPFSTDDGRGEGVRVSVTDTGIGIPAHLKEKIFDRFYQIDDTHTREQGGTGIGLALTKELVELHGGAISVTSELGKGSTFAVQLPLEYDTTTVIEQTVRHRDKLSYTDITETTEPISISKPDDSLPLLLIIEDNADMRRYIRTNIENGYHIAEAVNGEEGVAKAIETIPDLIISDVMMPKMDGFEVCRKLKTDERTSHIPIILLTAKAGQEHKVEGLETGADDYLVKPFDAKELSVRLINLQEQRKKLREYFQRELTSFPKSGRVQSADEQFLSKVFQIIEIHYPDSEFDLETLANSLLMSRMQLHRKIKAITGYTPGEFMRNFRLQKAAELLTKNTGTVSEIVFMIGYNNLSSFARQFHDKFGVNPSEYPSVK